MREILPGIHMWSRLSEPHGYDFNGHLVEHEDGNMVIDPVEPEAEDLAEIARRGAAWILLTNRNHSRAANAVRAATGAKVAIHPDDAAHARAQGTEIDASLAHGQHLGPFTVVNAAGKSPGEVALHWLERHILVVGDSLIGDPPGAVKLLPEDKLDDPALLRARVLALLDYDFDILLVGDGVPVMSGAKDVVWALAKTFPEA